MWVAIRKDYPEKMDETDKVVRDLELAVHHEALTPQWDRIVSRYIQSLLFGVMSRSR
jgi:hypothetical protein